MNYRPATHDDVPTLVTLAVEMHKAIGLQSWADPDLDHAALILGKLIDGAGLVGCAVTDDGEIAGYLAAAVLPIWWAPSVMTLQECHFWVQPKHRKSGAATMLVEAAEQWAKERGISSVIMTSEGVYMSKILAAFYRKRGYERSTTSYCKAVS